MPDFDLRQTLRADAAALRQELAELGKPGPRARICAMTTIAVLGSVLIALALHLDSPWWAAISGYMTTQASGPSSVRKGLLRCVGTIVGATAGFLMTPLFAYDHVAGVLCLFCIALLASLGSLLSVHGYAWLLMGITASLVALASMTEPLRAFETAVYRVIEVVLGTSVGMVVAMLLGVEAGADAVPSPPGWSDLLGENWPAVTHALRTAAAIALLPVIWSTFDLPGLGQTAITAAAVMAVPAVAGRFQENLSAVLHRGVLRLLGCLLGGLAGLALLGLPLADFFPWLALLGAGVWIAAHLQASSRGVGYLGIQAAIVFIMTLVQGQQAPASLTPGVERLAGIAGGLTILLLVTFVMWPDPEPAAALPDET